MMKRLHALVHRLPLCLGTRLEPPPESALAPQPLPPNVQVEPQTVIEPPLRIPAHPAPETAPLNQDLPDIEPPDEHRLDPKHSLSSLSSTMGATRAHFPINVVPSNVLAHPTSDVPPSVDIPAVTESAKAGPCTLGALNPSSAANDTTQKSQAADTSLGTESFDVPAPSVSHPSVTRPDFRSSMRPDDVCAHCWDGIFAEGFGLRSIPVFDQGGVWYGGYEYFVSYDEIRTCAGSNCVWYRLLARSVSGDLAARFEGQDKTKRRMRLTVGRPLSSEETGEPESEVLIVVIDKLDAFRVSMGTDNPAASWIKDWAGSLRVGTSDALALANAHVRDCVRGHQTCQDFFDWARPEASLPTRLIGCSDPLRPRIVESKGWDPHVRYVALSYVWGKNSQPNCTTSGNLSSYLEAMDISRLPRTVVDAIRVTHALGIRFLWVDSLCIIQDSCEDKNRELTKMRKVYRLAFLVIDVGSAKSASEGFLHDAEPPILVDASVWLPFTWSRQHEGHPRRFMDLFDVWPRAELISCDGDRLQNLVMRARGYTGERAWCLQEALMSGRRLRFGATLQFRCRSSPERIGNVKYHKLYGTTSAPDIIFHLDAPTLSLGSESWLAIHAAWADIVEDYSTRALSYPEDKLVACAGIAEAFGRALGPKADYLAGLWRDSLLWDLLWTVAPFSRSLGRCGDARAPSWSWAATDYPVDFRPYFMMRDGDAPSLQGQEQEELAEVVDCVVTLQDPALPFGSFTGGHLVLHAPVLGPYEMEALHYQQTDHLMLDEGYGCDSDQVRAQPSLWLVPLVFVSFSSRKSRLVHCLAVRPQTEEPNVCASSASGGCLEKVYRRVGAYSLLDSEEGGDEVLTHLQVDSLRSKIDGQWIVPRMEIKLI
ncbi:heterokaryon incompatibility protein-domain-containing protein [Cubamyces lactineus]|nr:heterokaryon incompatibility protein-domain-containing protein [Cubamyces lactineus]